MRVHLILAGVLTAALGPLAPGGVEGQTSGSTERTLWTLSYYVEKHGPEADLLVRTGDIDNFGFGWPAGFDPFSGRSTPRHGFPWTPGRADPPGTDRIMVVSGHVRAGGDGYTGSTRRPANRPQPVRLVFEPAGIPIASAALQLFLDDFQAPRWGTRFQVKLDGRDAPDIAAVVNELDQTGPIGKMVTVQLLPEFLSLLEDGELEIFFDDPVNDVADGFAIDFVQLLINPKGWRFTGTVRGTVVNAGTGAPLPGVLVSAGNVSQATTGADGSFELTDVPAGLVVVRGSHPDFLPGSGSGDLAGGETLEMDLRMEANEVTAEGLAEQLDRDGVVDLYGIYFDTDLATLRPDSEPTLQQVLELLTSRPSLEIVLGGHTDSQGDDDYNQALSERRAAVVVAWLTERGVAPDRLQSAGYGESRPVSDNATPEGRALNRRVEIRDARR